MGLSKKEKAAYSLGAVGKDMVYMLSASYMLYYSSETVTTVASSDELMILRGTMTIIPIVGMIIAVIIFAKKYILTDEKMKEIASVIRPGGKSQKEAGE